MALTLPELDDRTFDDLAEEARSLLVTYAPALTNHNASDPLVTLTELFAYLTDVMLFGSTPSPTPTARRSCGC